MKRDTRIRLTPSARRLFPDIGDRTGVLLRVEGWAVGDWSGIQVRVPMSDLEEADAPRHTRPDPQATPEAP